MLDYVDHPFESTAGTTSITARTGAFMTASEVSEILFSPSIVYDTLQHAGRQFYEVFPSLLKYNRGHQDSAKVM